MRKKEQKKKKIFIPIRAYNHKLLVIIKWEIVLICPKVLDMTLTSLLVSNFTLTSLVFQNNLYGPPLLLNTIKTTN